MNSGKIKYILFVILLASYTVVSSQQKFVSKGDQDFNSLQFQSAVENYLKAFKKMKDDSAEKDKLVFKIANSYRLMNNPVKSAKWYKQIIDTDFTRENPNINLYYAEALKQNGQSDKSKKYFKKFLEIFPDNELAANALMACEKYGDSSLMSPYIVKNLTLVNSENDDYSAVFSSKDYEEIIFSSNRKESVGKEKDNWTDAWFSDFYISKSNENIWNEALTADKSGILNTEANEGAGFFDSRFSSFYFTRCQKGARQKVYCEVLQTERSGQRWSRPKTVLSDTAANVGQPWISDDELLIYFASDHEGGYGGKDIWMASRKRKSNEFGDFKNLGAVINTSGDEMFPYFTKDSLLYFSSNGHPSYGGLDIFVSTLNDASWSEPENMLAPINSNGDDFAIVIKNGKKGFFSSNRNGGKGGDDIYSFKRKKLKFTLGGIVKDESSLMPLENVKISLLSNEISLLDIYSDVHGDFYVDSSHLYENNNYEILYSKEGYFAQRDSLNTFGFNADNEFNFIVEMKAIPVEPIVLPDILYDYDKWELKPQYRDSLNVLVRVLKDNPNLIIELRSHTDSRSNLKYNDELSQKRAQTVVDFLVDKGINRDRLVAKGYGERVPRIMSEDVNIADLKLKRGTVLDEKFIESVSSDEIKEKLYELNRRTEFKVISDDFIPEITKPVTITSVETNNRTEKEIPYHLNAQGRIVLSCYLNDNELKAIIDTSVSYSLINTYKVNELMETNILNINDIQGDLKDSYENKMLKNGVRIKIKSIRIGEKTYENKVLIISNDIKEPLMLGNNIVHNEDFEINTEDGNIIFK